MKMPLIQRTIEKQSLDRARAIAKKIDEIKWFKSQRKYLEIVRIIALSSPREDVILAHDGVKGTNAYDAAEVISEIEKVIKE